MILTDNRNLLRVKFRNILKELNSVEENIKQKNNVIIEKTKIDLPTLKIQKDGRELYLHSKYNPKKEAESLIRKLEDVESYDHVFFYGAGLGYHIQTFSTYYPNMKFSIYEPNKYVLYHYLSNQNLNDIFIDNIQTLLVETDEDHIKTEIVRLLQTRGRKVLIVALPSYERAYKEDHIRFIDMVKEIMSNKKSSLEVDAAFQKRWTENAIRNFPMLLETPNILHDIDKEAFKDKPALLVAAGPSLSEEFEQIRYIKDHGLAYIFSVGSAINALIEHNIYPDAVCTYDPSFNNQLVIQKMKEKNITEIPLIFGSSVGYETIEDYPGRMLHMIISQDTVAPYYLSGSELKIVYDAPSIAVVTYQLLLLLGCNRIILVGQNLSYLKNRRYAKGIKYDHVSSTLTEDELEETTLIDDVYGNKIRSNKGFNKMRAQLEAYISASHKIETINTTKGGAQIKGTTFMTLNQVITNYLQKREVQDGWYLGKKHDDLVRIEKQQKIMNRKQKDYEVVLNNLFIVIRDIKRLSNQDNLDRIEKAFAQFDKKFNRMKRNIFYQVFLEPMLRVQNERLSDESQRIRFEHNIQLKAKGIVEIFEPYLIACQQHFQFVLPLYEQLNERLAKLIIKKIGDEHE